jgi:hypothetical protein
MGAKKTSKWKYGKAAGEWVEGAMHEGKHGAPRSGGSGKR